MVMVPMWLALLWALSMELPRVPPCMLSRYLTPLAQAPTPTSSLVWDGGCSLLTRDLAAGQSAP
jgi:hypothetical protein